jgi:hypothetical protein
MNGKSALHFYKPKKREWGQELYNITCNRNSRESCAWFCWGYGDSKSLTGKIEKGKCLMCGKEEDPSHIMLKCSETKLQSEVYINNEWEHFCNEILILKITTGRKNH